ncbi:hypothetical protein [Silvibacterium dinghuense]|uniref:Uncharacterized protein n=1 Tax=Silvibacterium dinghuense TaxID=1560006 RepID=A0A4Q1SI84_9BACT|nr:hypothetical protein [Silvibacterium dinghuense]RXS97089.1 hypothetical protein ESZ00_03955 [Silvibacterium dinghuense]GGG96110.1 hypothetical protein GCM10011586_09030 [Silvibacterium dinghuense]
MQNYFNYFTEIEVHFQRRRGSLLLLSTLDWALIETWREAGIPLEAVLRGIDTSFDKFDARAAKTRVRRVNGLAYCSQAIMEAVEEMKEAATGAAKQEADAESAAPGFEQERIAAHLRECAQELGQARLTSVAAELAATNITSLNSLAEEALASQPNLEELDRRLLVMEEKLLSALMATAPEEELVTLRTESERELAPYKARMQAAQIKQVEQQFLHKRLFERYRLPRLSLFYMRQG